jgi:hypothetical protein
LNDEFFSQPQAKRERFHGYLFNFAVGFLDFQEIKNSAGTCDVTPCTVWYDHHHHHHNNSNNLLLLLQYFDELAAFHLDLLQAILFIVA